MANDITETFVKYFESEVHTAYQQQGSKLGRTVRSRKDVIGASAVFQKVGKGTASTKARHGLVQSMNLEYSSVECPLYDYYAGDYVDKLDQIKTNHDDIRALAVAGAYALGRKSDELIIAALDKATNAIGDYTEGFGKELIMQGFSAMNTADVPDDGSRFALVGPRQWNALLNMKEFSSSEYAGSQYPLLDGTESRKWLGIVWIMHTGLPLDEDGTERDCFMYHSSAIGHAVGKDITTDITWHGDRAAYFVNNMMSQGACLIDNGGIIRLKVKEDAELA